MDTIAMDLKLAFAEIGYVAEVNLKLAPAWTTDMISENGRRKLEEYGIAAPLDSSLDKAALLDGERLVKCTNCGSQNTNSSVSLAQHHARLYSSVKIVLNPLITLNA